MPRSLLKQLPLLFVAGLLCWPCLAADPAGQPAVKKELQTKDAAGTQESEEPGKKFLRLNRDEEGNLTSMDTAIVRYVFKDAQKNDRYVDLIGVVHIGEKSYYARLNEQFKEYDALLYELVAPEGKNVPQKGEGSRHPLGAVQNGMKDILDLEFQLAHIDYGQKNFVHADMSPEAFSKSMTDRGESFWQILLRSMGQGIAMESRNQAKGSGGAGGMNMLMAWFSPNRALVMKRMMAEQFEDLETSMKTFDGPDGSTIISERNKIALKVLSEQMTAGKKRIGIFYGAGHMPDMQRRLVEEFQLKPHSQQWLVAWDLKTPAKPKSPAAGGEGAPKPDDK